VKLLTKQAFPRLKRVAWWQYRYQKYRACSENGKRAIVQVSFSIIDRRLFEFYGTRNIIDIKLCKLTKRTNWTELNWTELALYILNSANTELDVEFSSVQFSSLCTGLYAPWFCLCRLWHYINLTYLLSYLLTYLLLCHELKYNKIEANGTIG